MYLLRVAAVDERELSRRRASARPIFLPRPVSRMAAMRSLTVAWESTAQCDTTGARPGLDEARARPDRASAFARPAAVCWLSSSAIEQIGPEGVRQQIGQPVPRANASRITEQN